MFSQEPHCIYKSNPLMEVICQLRFPEILSIGANPPVEFQEAIRDIFPRYSTRMETPAPKLSGVPGNLQLEKQPQKINYQFASADNTCRVNLTSNFISLATTRYRSWDAFAQQLDKPLAAFIQIYKPAMFERIGLRYVNGISRKALDLEGIPFQQLISPCYLGPLAEEDVPETATNRCNLDYEMALRGGCRLKLRCGPGLSTHRLTREQEVRFILDLDLFMTGNLPVNISAGALQTLHSQAFPIFRGAITHRLHEAMEPEYDY